MNVRKRITDYPAIFWAALIATVVGGWMSVHAYKAMLHADDALIRSIGMFVVLECVSIFAAATMNTRGQGLLVGLAFVLIFGCAGTEIFLGASELQRGVMQMTETAKAATASTTNDTANASALTTAQEGLKSCQARYPRKKKDAQARTECAKPYEQSIAALTAGEPTKAVTFDPEAAGMLALWQGITDAYNAMLGKEGEEAAKVEQVAFIAMLSIFTVFVIGKLFLWSKYAAWKTANYGDDYQTPNAVIVPEHHLGTPAAVEPDTAHDGDGDGDDQIDTHGQPYKQPKQGFGLIPTGNRVASSADRNRAAVNMENATVPQVMQLAGMSSPTVTCNTQMPVNTGNCNIQIPVGNSINSENSTVYTQVQAAKVGSLVNCPNCGTAFVKANKWHTFCSNNRKPRVDGGNCSDDYHNEHNPERVVALKAKLCKQRG